MNAEGVKEKVTMSLNFIIDVIKRGEKNSFVDPHCLTDIEENEKFGGMFEREAPVKARLEHL